MDTTKTVLLALWLGVTFLIWQTWEQDYGIVAQQDKAVGLATESRLPSEIPQASALGAGALEEPQVEKGLDENTLLTVDTDLLLIKINPIGGDIVYAALRDFKQKQDKNEPYELLNTKENTFYIAQSGLIGLNGPERADGTRSIYQSTETHYSLHKHDNSLDVVLTSRQANQWELTKTFHFKRGHYDIEVTHEFKNLLQEATSIRHYAQVKLKPQVQAGGMMGTNSFSGFSWSTVEEPYEKIILDDLTATPQLKENNQGWVASVDHYFLTAWIPQAPAAQLYAKKQKDRAMIGFVENDTVVLSGESEKFNSKLYIGPKNQEILASVAERLDLTIDYGWLWFLAKPLFWLLSLFHDWVNNWGVAIILVTLTLKIAFFKLSATSYRSMAKMKKLQPQMASLKELHGNNREAMSKGMMELYQKEKVNPFGGCLPILVQIPVFIALYWVLLESVELRHAPLFGWIQDLSSKDPYYVLPILMGATMFCQQLLNPTPTDNAQAMMMKILPIVFTFFFLFFPAGLVLYWFVNNLLSIGQQWLINRAVVGQSA